MNQVSAEKFIEQLELDVYPITIIKFLLNKKRILSYFTKALDKNFEVKLMYKVDHTDCELCKQKEDENILCRQHTSINRILSGNNVAYDLDTNTYFYKNEIFRMVDDKLVIIYCPHPKLINGEITDSKVRKIIPITVFDPGLTALPEYEKVKQFLSSDLMDKNLKCWFNNEFSIVTLPKDRNVQNWCLISNK